MRTESGWAAHLIGQHRLELGGKVVSRPAVEHRTDQRGFQRLGARAAHVERDATVRVSGLGALVAGERGGGVHRDAIPDVLHPVALHPVIEQPCPHEVGAAHLEPLAAVSGRREADVVQHRAEVQHLVVELDAIDGGERGRELVAALTVGRDNGRAQRSRSCRTSAASAVAGGSIRSSSMMTVPPLSSCRPPGPT
jgi:hypothetical protein